MINNVEQIKNPVKKALIKRETTLGTWIQLGHPGIAEVFANAGFDWIAADLEHSDIDVKSFTSLVRGIYGRRSVPLARVKENDTLAIRQVLDAGAGGVIVPLVNTAEEAVKAVRAAKFPPEGIRGFAFFRANNWGVDFDAYVQEANRETVVVVMVESKQAVDNIDEILKVEGVDGIIIGPYDMSGSYGVVGKTSDPIIMDACKTVLEACKRHKKSAGIHIVKPTEEAVKAAIEDGFNFIALGMDTVFLDEESKKVIKFAKGVDRFEHT